KSQQALRGLALRQLTVEPPQQRHLQRNQPLLACRQRLSQGVAQFVEGLGQLAKRRCVASFAGLMQRTCAQLQQSLRRIEYGSWVGKPGVHLGLPEHEFMRLVGGLAEPTVFVQLVDPGLPCCMPKLRGTLPGRLDGGQIRQRLQRLRLDPQIRLAQMIAQAVAQPGRGDLLLDQKTRPGRIGLGQLAAPGVGQQRIDDLAVVGGQLAVEITPDLKYSILQRPLAETVDGEDRRLIEAVYRQQQTAARGFVRMAGMQPIEKVILAWLTLVNSQQLGQPRTDALAQLGGGGGGVGDHQNLTHRQLALQQQAGVKRSQSPGLAGAGAGFDQAAAAEGGINQVQAHASSSSSSASASRIGPMSCSANVSNRSSSGSLSRYARAFQGSRLSPSMGLNSAPSQASRARLRAVSSGSLPRLGLRKPLAKAWLLRGSNGSGSQMASR